MSDATALSEVRLNSPALPWTDLSPLPDKLSKRLWVSPTEFLITTHALEMACFDLEAARWTGLVADYQQTALVYSVMLGVALVAHRHQRPELAGSRTRVLAAKTIP